MYLDYYELRKFPFRTNPDPKFLWFGEKHTGLVKNTKQPYRFLNMEC